MNKYKKLLFISLLTTSLYCSHHKEELYKETMCTGLAMELTTTTDDKGVLVCTGRLIRTVSKNEKLKQEIKKHKDE